MTHTPTPAEIETLRKGVEKAARWFDEYADEHYAKAKTASNSSEVGSRESKGLRNKQRANELRAILDRLTPTEPEVDEATKIWRETFARGYSAVGFNMSAANVRDGRHDVDPKFAEAAISYLREVLAAKDAERDALAAENFRLAAGVCIYPNGEGLLGDDHGNSFCSVEQERKRLDERETDLMADLNKAESELAALRAENERLKVAFIRLLDATDRFNGICAHNKQPMARLQGDMILAVMNAYRVLGIGRTKAAERNTAEPAKETTVSYDPNYKCPSCGVAIGVLHEPDCALMLSRTAKPAKTHVWPATHDDACSEIKGAETTPEVVVTPLVPTFEQAEVYRKHITEAEARGRREALEAATARLEWYRQYGAGMIDQRGFAASLIAELKRMMTGGK